MCAQKSCCDWFFAIFRKYSSENPGNQESFQPPLTNNQNKPREHNDASANENNYLNQPHQNEPPPQNNTIYLALPIIKTDFRSEEIHSHVIPDKLKEIKYNCPICLKFFNHILVLTCCKNYLCLFCLNNYIETSQKYMSKLKCLICNFSEQLCLEDVDPKSQVSRFDDN